LLQNYEIFLTFQVKSSNFGKILSRMMELQIDLFKREAKSRFRVIGGIIFFLVGIGLIMLAIIGKEKLMLFKLIFYVLYALLGIVHIMSGLGYPVEKLFGKAYILINSEIISIKPGVFEKEQSVKWSDIQSINYKLNKYVIQKTDNETLVIELSKFEYIINKEIKKTIDYFIQEKNR